MEENEFNRMLQDADNVEAILKDVLTMSSEHQADFISHVLIGFQEFLVKHYNQSDNIVFRDVDSLVKDLDKYTYLNNYSRLQ